MVQQVGTSLITGGISQSSSAIEKDAYLIIVAGEQKDALDVLPYSRLTSNKSSNLLNTPLKQNIANVVMAGVTSPIVQNFASKQLPTALLGRINSSLYDIMADGAIHCEEVAEDFIGSCTNQLDNIATDLGFPTPSALYDALKPSTATGVLSKDLTAQFMNKFAKASMQQNSDITQQQADTLNVVVVKLKLVQEDTENLNIDIPTRKTENNFNIATAVNNQNMERTFEAKIVHNPGKKSNMIDVKNRLKAIRDMKDHVNVFICDEDINELEVIENCLLSSLSFGIEQKNALSCQIGFTKVPKWYVKVDASLDKSLNGSATTNGQSVPNRNTTANSNAKNKAVKVEAIKNFEIGNKSGYDSAQALYNNYQMYKNEGYDSKAKATLNSLTDRLNVNKANHGHKFTPTEVEQILNAGGQVVKIDN